MNLTTIYDYALKKQISASTVIRWIAENQIKKQGTQQNRTGKGKPSFTYSENELDDIIADVANYKKGARLTEETDTWDKNDTHQIFIKNVTMFFEMGSVEVGFTLRDNNEIELSTHEKN